MKKLLIGLIMVFVPSIVSAQVTVPFTFTPSTTALSSQVNSNFTTLANAALNRTGGTMTGLFTSQQMVPTASATWDLGSSTFKYRNLFLSGDVSAVTGTFTGTVTGVAGTFSGAVSGTTGGFSGTVTAPLFSGSGASLTTIPRSALNVYVIQTKNANYTALNTDNYVTATGAGTVITLYACSGGNVGRKLDVKSLDGSNAISITAGGGDTIDGSASYSLAVQYQAITVVCTSANVWSIY